MDEKKIKELKKEHGELQEFEFEALGVTLILKTKIDEQTYKIVSGWMAKGEDIKAMQSMIGLLCVYGDHQTVINDLDAVRGCQSALVDLLKVPAVKVKKL